MKNFAEEKQRNYDDFTYIPNLILKSLGLDLLDSPKPLWLNVLMKAYSILCFLIHWYIIYNLVIQTLQWEENLAGNPLLIMRFGIIYCFVCNVDVKLILFLYHRRRLKNLNDNLNDLYPKDDAQKRDYKVNDFFWPRIARYGFYYYYSVFVFVVFGPITQSTFIYIYQRFKLGDEAEFIYLSTYPMELYELWSLGTYSISFIMDFTFSHLVLNLSLGTDIWMMCHSAQLCMHFSYLGRKLAEYSPSRAKNREDCEFLSNFVRKHQQLFVLQKELNDIFGIMLAYNLFTMAITLCCIILYTILQGFNREGVGFLLFFISVTAQFFMVSYYGQLLSDLSENIALAAYTHNWYNASIAYRKHLLLIMQRAQRPAALSAKGVIIISLDTFKRMLSNTYYFTTVTRRVLSK